MEENIKPSDEYFDREGGGMCANIFLILNIFSHKNHVILFYNIIKSFISELKQGFVTLLKFSSFESTSLGIH